MKTASSSERSQANSNQHEKYIPIRLGIGEHLLRGDMGFFDLGVYTTIHLQADFSTGIWRGSAERLLATAPRGVSLRQIQRTLKHFTGLGYLKSFRKNGERGNTPYLIDKFTVRSGARSGHRLNAAKSESLQELCYELVAEGVALPVALSGTSSRSTRSSTNKKKEVSRYDRRRLSLSGEVWEELKIKTLPTRYEGFVETVEANPCGDGQEFVAWCRRIMDLCGDQGIRYPRIFFKRFKEAEGVAEQKGTDTRSGEGYSVPEAIYVQA